ncbi:hypothetical protein [Pseudonocardia sp. ICBG601]|uniref:hypothetical protein n=1 Tax=Pseudonocardia sp. ICBG601 TaxID=2846759 RepID=UPI001CF61E3C|nr:hypothetical protein [Pseudonocardia sp. ICBG601]
MSDRSDPMGPDDILVIASQDFTVRGNKDLYQASYALMSYFSGLCRHGRIADAYAGPTQPPAEHGYDPDDLGGEHLTVRIEVIADTVDHGTTTALETMHRGFTTLARTLPDQYSPDEIQVLTIAIGGDDLTITHLDRTAAYRRVGLTP